MCQTAVAQSSAQTVHVQLNVAAIAKRRATLLPLMCFVHESCPCTAAVAVGRTAGLALGVLRRAHASTLLSTRQSDIA